MVRDAEHHESRYNAWKDEVMQVGVVGLNKINSKIYLDFIFDMEVGRNIARGTKKGARSKHRLNTLRSRIKTILQLFEKHKVALITCTEKQVHDILNSAKRVDGSDYENSADLKKDFKALWHWLMLVNRKLHHSTNGKEGCLLDDITIDLDTSKPENNFVYFTKEQMEKMLPYFNENDQTLLLFAFDTVIRTGKELSNVRVNDLDGIAELTIRDETAKTFGRTIKLTSCKDALQKYIKKNKLQPDDYLFNYSAAWLNRKLKKVAVQLFGDKMTKGGKKFSEISLYDFRHSGACHHRQNGYKTKIDALMYRLGHSDLKMLNYYTKKIGMQDSIEESDLMVESDKSEFEKLKIEVEKLKNDAVADNVTDSMSKAQKQEIAKQILKNLGLKMALQQ